MGRGFEFVGGAIVPLGMGSAAVHQMLEQNPDAVGNLAPATQWERPEVVAQVVPKRAHVAEVKASAPTVTTKPMNVLRAAKKRLAEINRHLKVARKLEHEAEQLRRLIAAAEGKPSAVVRSIARSAG